MKRINAKQGARLVALIAERRKLVAEYRRNRRRRIQLQHQLDEATTQLAAAVGLELFGNRRKEVGSQCV